MNNGGRNIGRDTALPVNVMDDEVEEGHIQPPFTTAFSLPSHVISAPGGRKDFGPSSSLWDNERPLDAVSEPTHSKRRVAADMQAPAEMGARIGGVSVTPRKRCEEEVTYDVERMLPVPGANAAPLTDSLDPSARFYRFTAVSQYNRGQDINFSHVGPGEAPDSREVLANLDRVTMLADLPDGFSAEEYAEKLERPLPNPLRALGSALTMAEFPRWSKRRGVPFNETYVDRNDPEIASYSNNRFKMDLTRDFGRFFPSFPYVAKDHPNRYFNDVASHLRTLHPIWAMYGNDTLARGWNAFAQDRTGDRKPTAFSREFLPGSDIDGISPMFISELERIKLPANSSISLSWTVHHPHHNVALFMGPRGGNVFALDIDVTDRAAIEKIVGIIEREVGLSPFIRVGSYPKIALIYRMAPGEVMRSRVATFTDPDLGAIEIQGVNKALTAYGIHHRLKSCFQWIGSATPAEHGPEYAPTLSAADLDHLLSVIEEEVGEFAGGKSWNGEIRDGVHTVAGEGDWVINAEGLIVDGRHKFVSRSTFMTMQQYAGNVRVVNMIEDAAERRAATDDLADALTGIIAGATMPRIVCDSRWSETFLVNTVRSDVLNMIRTGHEREKFAEYDTAEPIPLDGEIVASVARLPSRGRLSPSVADRAVESVAEKARTEIVPLASDVLDVSMADAPQPSARQRMRASGFSGSLITRGGKVGLLAGASERAVRRWLIDKAAISSGRMAVHDLERIEQEAFDLLEQERQKWLPDDDGNRCRDAVSRIAATILPARLLQNDRVVVSRGFSPIPMPKPSQSGEIAGRMAEVISSVSDEIYARIPLDANRPVLLIDAPTGAGKTSRMIEEIVRDPRTVEDMLYLNDKDEPTLGRRPVVIAMPTYDNIKEAVSRARLCGINPYLDDDAFLDEVERLEIMGRGDARTKLAELREVASRTRRDTSLAPLDIQVYSGRERAGCPYVSAISTLGEAGQGGDRMCKAEKIGRDGKPVRDDEGKPVMTLCPRYTECAYIRQKSSVSTAHVVFIPHAFLGEGRLPEALKHARVLIVDEQIHPQYLHRAFLKFEDFVISPEIFRYWQILEDMEPEKRERYEAHNAKMVDYRSMLAVRNWLISRVFQALRAKKDPARALMGLREGFDREGWRQDEIDGSVPGIDEDDEGYKARSRDRFCCDERYVQPLAEISVDEWGVQYFHGDLPQSAMECGTVDVAGAFALIDELARYLARQDTRITPATDREAGPVIPEAVQNKLDQPGVRNARAERRMWQALSERITALARQDQIDNNPTPDQARYEVALARFEQMLDDDPSLAPMIAAARRQEAARNLGFGRRLHERDARFQYVVKQDSTRGQIVTVEALRFSWRDTAGWERTPVVLLDASASTRVIGKIFMDREIRVHRVVEDVGASLNMHLVAVTGVSGLTFSNASLIGGRGIAGQVNAAINLATIRDGIATICSTHANTRVVMGAVKKVREAVMTGWAGRPASLDSCHFGAIRGIDAYKAHGASICLGRMELAVEEIDALAACLSWDDDTYEAPFNLHGNGTTDGNPSHQLFQPDSSRVVRLRDGGTATFQTPTIPGVWGAIIQKQARDEEINQFIGRLRPVYRSDDRRPTCYIMSNTFPEHLILDDVVSIYDIAGAVPAEHDRPGNFPLAAPEIAIGDFDTAYRDRSVMAGILQDCAWSDPSGCFLAPQAILESGMSSLVPGVTDNRDNLYRLLLDYGFQSIGPWMRDGTGEERFGVPLDQRPMMADGWVGMAYQSGNGQEGIWTPSVIWPNVEVAIEALYERVRLLGGTEGKVMLRPKSDGCHRKMMDSLDHLIRSGYEYRAAVNRHTLTAAEEIAIQATADAARRPMRRMFADALNLLTRVQFGQIVGGRTIQSPAFRPVRNGHDAWRMMPAIVDILDSADVSTSTRGQELRDLALARPLTTRQIAAMLSLWHVTSRGSEAHDELPITGLTRMIQARISKSQLEESDSVEADVFVPTEEERLAQQAVTNNENVRASEPASERLVADDVQPPEVRSDVTRESASGPIGDIAFRRVRWGRGVYRPAINLVRRTPPRQNEMAESTAGIASAT
mgnify:CR=1 FL=1